MEKKDFVNVYSAGKMYEAELIVGFLETYDIEATIMNKRDSNYLFGDVEIYVAEKDAEKAKQIIANREKE
jgi:hypothetical protein